VRVAVVGHVEWVDFVEVDRLPKEGEVLGARHASARAAGGGGVAAVVLAELGAEVDFFCALGDDEHGHAAADQLTERGVSVLVAWRSDPTRRAITMLERSGERTIVTIGERLEPLGSDDLNWQRLSEAQGVYFTAGDVAALAQARQARVLVATPRARHSLGEPGELLSASGEPLPELDALVYSGHDPHEMEWAHHLSVRARLTVETRGKDGGVWSGESEGSWQAVPAPGPPRDSYGCGDSFAAGFTFGLAEGLAVAQATAVGAECGARCLARVGAP
jgi:ribokinase